MARPPTNLSSADSQRNAVLTFRKAFKNAPWQPISRMQADSFRERPLKADDLVCKVDIPPLVEEPDASLRDLLWSAMCEKSEGVERLDPPVPYSVCTGQWVGVMREVGPANVSNVFEEIELNSTSRTTLFYLSGGAWFRAGPPGARPILRQLSKDSGARIFTTQPRLVPQYTLPSLILDALVGYFYLLAPPPGALHEPLQPKDIIFVSESGGTVLHLAIIQLLQHLRFNLGKSTLRINGRSVSLEMPAGCALSSQACDAAIALPSSTKHAQSDWCSERAPWHEPLYPADGIWPARPARGDLFADNSALCHPYIDPTHCSDWRGAPRMWIQCGEETFSDGVKVMAQRMAACDVPTTLVEYEFMPHVFQILLPALPQSRYLMKLWAAACADSGRGGARKESEAWFVKLGALEMVQRPIHGVVDLTFAEAVKMMRNKRDAIKDNVWKGPPVGMAKI